MSDLVAPRIGSRRRSEVTLGPLLAKVAGELGVDLHPWQRHVSDVSLELVERRGQGSRLRLGAGSVGVVVGRQSGKTTLVAARVALQCLAPQLDELAGIVGADSIRPQHVAYTAQDRASALARWHEHVDMVMSSPLAEHVSRVVLQRGDEALRFKNGSYYKVVTPSATGARGLSLDLVVIDEALAHPVGLLSTLRPTMAQRDGAQGCIGAQLVIVSNAGDERSTLLNEQRELGRRAVAEDDRSRCWFEWSAADDADPYDEAVWASTIPTLDARDGIGREFIRAEAESMDIDDFAREYLCRYTPRSVARVIDPAVWEALPADEMAPGQPVVLGLDATTDRGAAAIAASGVLLGDPPLVVVELVDHRPGVEWLAQRVIDLVERHSVMSVVVDVHGPLASVIPVLERGGVRVTPARTRELVEASGGFCDLVAAGRLAHMADARLDEAVGALGRRKIGDRWVFARGEVDVSPLIAASLAAWGADVGAVPEPAIHAL